MTKQTRTRRTPRKSKRRERYPAAALTPHHPEMEAESALYNWGESAHDQLPHRQAEQLQGLHLSSVQRQAMAMEIVRTQGNRQLASFIKSATGVDQTTNDFAVQTKKGEKKSATNPGGRGPGAMQGAKEQFYEVKGKHLADLLPQLEKLDGFAAKTRTPVSFSYAAPKQTKDKWTTTITWKVDESTAQLPRWVDYDAACPTAQQEWDRYMQQTRRHEEAKHITAVKDYLKTRPKVFSAATADELVQTVESEGKDVLEHLQSEIHDKCGHGAEIDAILHADRDSCE